MAGSLKMIPHLLAVEALTPEGFAPFGQIIATRTTGGQGVNAAYDPDANPEEAQLVLTNGRPRLWLMHSKGVGTKFTHIARHRKVTQCLGSMGGKEWLIAVAPPGDPSDAARPGLKDIRAFRIPGDQAIMLDVATWHAGPHYIHEDCLFFNLENMDTGERDFHQVDLGIECRYQL